MGPLPYTGICDGLADSGGQPVRRQVLFRYGRRSHTQRFDPRSPKGLVEHKWHDHTRHASAQAFRPVSLAIIFWTSPRSG